MKPIDIDRVFEEVHPDDLGAPEAEQTTWRWHALTAPEEAIIKDRSTRLVDAPGGGTDMVLANGTATMLRLKLGLAPPVNFGGAWADEPCGVIKRKRPCPTDAAISRIPTHVRNWLAGKIHEASVVSESDAGKSSRPSTESGATASSPTADVVVVTQD